MNSAHYSNINAYINAHMHTIITDEKRSHEFEAEWGGIHERVWRKRREGGNVTIISKRKELLGMKDRT